MADPLLANPPSTGSNRRPTNWSSTATATVAAKSPRWPHPMAISAPRGVRNEQPEADSDSRPDTSVSLRNRSRSDLRRARLHQHAHPSIHRPPRPVLLARMPGPRPPSPTRRPRRGDHRRGRPRLGQLQRTAARTGMDGPSQTRRPLRHRVDRPHTPNRRPPRRTNHHHPRPPTTIPTLNLKQSRPPPPSPPGLTPRQPSAIIIPVDAGGTGPGPMPLADQWSHPTGGRHSVASSLTGESADWSLCTASFAGGPEDAELVALGISQHNP